MESDEWTLEKLFGVSESYWQSCALHASVKLELFTLIGNTEVGEDEVAVKLPNVDFRGVTMLLNVMAAMGLLVKKKGVFSNTAFSIKFLVKDSPQYLGHIILHYKDMVETWARLDQAVESGKPLRKPPPCEQKEWESFLMGMFNRAMGIAPGLAKQINLKDKTRLLDLGGGPGTYAIHFCLENPKLKATVYDLPMTMPFAKKIIEKFGLSDRIDFMPGDYLAENIPGNYDVVWLSHILHAFGSDTCQKIIGKAVSALQSEGLLLVHDFILNDTLDSPLFPTLFSLNMLLHTEKGQTYSIRQIKDMLGRAGLREIQRLLFRGHNDSGIIAGKL